MKVEKLMANNQPNNWLNTVTNECAGYPMDLVDIERDELVLDIGANVGGFWNAWKFRFDNWHLVEPSKYNCEQIRANGYKGSYSRNAVGAKSGEKLKLMKYWGEGDYEEVITLCFEDVTKNREIGLLKIDCEGAEYDFLIHADLSKIKYIVMELHNFLGGVKQKELMTHIENTHKEIYSEGDGNDSHYVKLWKRK